VVSEPPLLRNSERSTFNRCMQKWYWHYVEGLKPRYEPDAVALWFGTGIHEILANWYKPGFKRGANPVKAWEKWYAAEERELQAVRTSVSESYDDDKYVEAGDLGAAMIDGYVKRYGRDTGWDVIYTEHTFRVQIPDPRKRAGTVLCILSGTFDGVFSDSVSGDVQLMEHKTAKIISTGHLPLDNQAGTYWMAANLVLRDEGVLGKGEMIKGIQYNYLRKALPDQRPKDLQGRCLNKDGSVSKVQPKPLFERPAIVERGPREYIRQLERIQQEAILMNRVRTGKQPIIKNTSYDCQYCPFFEMCMLEEKGGNQWKQYRDAMYERRDPYPASYRKSAAE
jgi:hypothetical protein